MSDSNSDTKFGFTLFLFLGNEDNEQESLLIDSNEWFVEQTMEDERTPQHLLHRYKYGFAGKHEGLGTKYEVSFPKC